MREKKEYRSAVRSRRLIRQALLELLQEKPFEKITITDIVNRADLNRSTFYAHYPDIHGVVEEIQDEIENRNMELIRKLKYRNILLDPMPYLQGITSILQENVELLKRLGHTEFLHNRLDNFRRLMVTDILEHSSLPQELRQSEAFSIHVHFFIGGIMNTYQQWAEGTLECSLEEISAEIAQLIQNSGEALLKTKGITL